MIQQGDMVGLFSEYGPDKCCYLGLAEYIGQGTPPEEAARAGEFDGRHINLNKWTGISVGIGHKQMSFRLLESEEIVYEQEVWYAPQKRIQKLLDGCKHIHGAELSDIRSAYNKKKELDKNLPLTADGFLEIHLSFKNFPLPSEAKGDDFDTDAYMFEKIKWALAVIGFYENDITFKMRKLNEYPKDNI